MKHIRTYESIGDEILPDNIKLVNVLWNGIYRCFTNELGQLDVGDYTDKGIVLQKNSRNNSSDLSYTTDEGTFRANLFKVYTSNNWWDLQDFIKTKIDKDKYNL